MMNRTCKFPTPQSFGPLALFLLFFCATALVPAAETAGNSTTSNRVFSLDDALTALGNSAREGGAEFRWDPFFSSGVFSAAGHNLSFRAGEPGEPGFFLLDGKDLYAVPAPYLVRELLYFPEEFVTAVGQVLFPPQPSPPPPPPQNTPPPLPPPPVSRPVEDSSRFRIAAIIVDPGHGGKDPGAIGNFTRNGRPWSSIEKEITLKVSQEIHALLSRTYPSKRILLTRDRDTFPSLQDRVDIANSVPLAENEAVIFISIHANSSLNKNARGFEVWYLDPDYRRELIDKSKYGESAAIVNWMLEEEFTTESILMGQNILNRMGEALGNQVPNRGLKAEKWFVVRNAQMPAILVELPFVTNLQDAEIMADDAYLKKFAEAIYKGITDFVGTFERSGGFTAIQ
ncbi:MAG: N-acetylmuramoyl-L-alanine amidase [Treponema sp.]|jgi:N-acetylmuramoyl-L-alanine amidase|nr:N-acetylmuramoyl-L-alanine amidase [Treponema sp.]